MKLGRLIKVIKWVFLKYLKLVRLIWLRLTVRSVKHVPNWPSVISIMTSFLTNKIFLVFQNKLVKNCTEIIPPDFLSEKWKSAKEKFLYFFSNWYYITECVE